MRKLIPIDGWAESESKSGGSYQDQNGHKLSGFFKYEYKNKIQILVLSNGYVMVKYSFPRLENPLPFQSPMVRWANLHFCGGWTMKKPNTNTYIDELDIIDAIINKQKPAGFACAYKEADTQLMEDKVKTSGLPYTIRLIKHPNYPYFCYVWMGQPGSLEANFDIDAWLTSYKMFEEKLGYPIIDTKEQLQLLKKQQLFDVVMALPDEPRTNFDFMLTGLLFGYPIESTIALLTGGIK